MRSKTPIRELSQIFATPTSFAIATPLFKISLASSQISIRRSSDQIEFIVAGEQPMLITLPMSVEGVERMRVIAMQIQRLDIELMTEYRVETLRFTPLNGSANSILADVAVQPLPHNFTTLKESIQQGKCDTTTLLQSIETLERALQRERIYFKGAKALSPENIIVGDDMLLYPLRYSQLRSCGTAQEAAVALNALRDWVVAEAEAEAEAKERSTDDGVIHKGVDYAPRIRDIFEGHLWASNINEERVIVEEITGWGFVDGDNRIVVEPCYSRVFPFREGRAVVLSDQGWGLIDLYGGEVIPSIYASLSYNCANGVSCVKSGDLWGYFSYLGEQLTPFEHPHPNEDISLEELRKLTAQVDTLT